MAEKVFIEIKLNTEEKKGSETDYGLKGYYNTESRVCTKKILNL